MGEVSVFFSFVAVEDDDWKFCQNFLMIFPLIEPGKLIIPEQEKNFALRIDCLYRLKRMIGVAGFAGLHFLIVGPKSGISPGNRLHHPQPVGCWKKRSLSP